MVVNAGGMPIAKRRKLLISSILCVPQLTVPCRNAGDCLQLKDSKHCTCRARSPERIEHSGGMRAEVQAESSES